MRRRTPGVISTDEFLPEQLARLATKDPAEVVQILEPLVSEGRRGRINDVLSRRLRSVRVMFDSPHDPHNGAAIVRSCEAFGVQYAHVVERRERFLLARSVARSTQQWIEVVRHETVKSAIDTAKAEGLKLVAAHPAGNLSPDDLSRLPNVAIVLGNERDGIAQELADACDDTVRVPMRGFVESLNVSVTGAILLNAATRGRPGDLTDAERLRMYARGLYFSVPRADEVLFL